MKRFLMFMVIAIAVVSLGLTIYYFSTDNEVIYIKSSYLVVDVRDVIPTDGENGLLEFKNRSKYTTLSYSVQQDDDILEYSDDHFYRALKGGESKIIITTNNMNYSRLVIDVTVCDGSEDYPYIIKTEEELKQIGHPQANSTQNTNSGNVNTASSAVSNADETATTQTNAKTKYALDASYKLGNDISLTSSWTPIGAFKGTFDGNFFAINNMVIDSQSGATINAGFVSVLESGATIKNLFLNDVNIDVTAGNVGAFAGLNNGTIQTSEATGKIKNTLSGSTTYVGGVVGSNVYSDKQAKIDRCGFSGTVSTVGSGQIAGGIAGYSRGGMISESYFRGIVANGESYFGGIVGKNEGSADSASDIYDCYFYMTETNENTRLTNMAGVIYTNSNGSAKSNMVSGCYYGGEFAKVDMSNIKSGSATSSPANGYLTKEEFGTQAKFITFIYASADKENRTWNFDSVWEYPAKKEYPILNIFSSVGSTYLIDVSDITTENDIATAEKFYDVLTGRNGLVEGAYKLTDDIDFGDENGFVWGDENHPIPETFTGTIINPDGKEIKNLTIRNNTENANVGIVRNLASSAIISGLKIKNVTITGAKAGYVGVLAGVSNGASVYDTTIENVTVNLSGYAFGTLFGYAANVNGQGISNVSAKYVDGSNNYFVYAGGFVGINTTTITASKSVYNYAYNIRLTANYLGGIAGANSGSISYSTAYFLQFNKKQDSTTITNVYSGNYNVFIGGIVGLNEFTISNTKVKGAISDVYANASIIAETGAKYNIYTGGIAGHNSGNISRAYVKGSTFTVSGSNSVFVGGLVAYNTGKMSNSVVDKDSKISTTVVASVGATSNSSNYILNTKNCSVVGGLVGYDAVTSDSTASIYQCASYMSDIKGYYAGGLTGISFGRIEKCYCGDSTVVNGGVTITGYMVGGLVGVTAGGFVIDSYTFAKLATVAHGGTYSNVLSVVRMEVSAMAGLTVFVLNQGTVMRGCYAIVSFSGNGVSYGSAADLTGYKCGTISNCAYQTSGSISTSYATQISADNFKGADVFRAFANIVGTSNLKTWSLSVNSYPTLEGVNVRFPNSTLPTFH